MRRRPGYSAWILLAAILPLIGLGVIAGSAQTASLWVVLSLCARAWATATSLPVVLTLALIASIWVPLLWLLGRNVLIGRRAVRLARRHAVVPPEGLLDTAHALGVRRLLVTDLPEQLAFCAGLARPTVVVSAALVRSLDAAALTAVLAHEAAHARRRDPLRQTLAHAVGQALWFAPAAREAAEHQRLRRELAADEFAGEQCGRRALAEALLMLYATPSQVSRPAIAGATSALAARIEAITPGSAPIALRASRAAKRRSAAGIMIVGLLLVAVIASPDGGSEPFVAMPMSVLGMIDMAIAWVLRAAAIALGWMILRRWFPGVISRDRPHAAA